MTSSKRSRQALCRAPKGRQAAFLKITSPDHHMVGISDVAYRRDPAARKLVGQHQQIELLTVIAALGAHAVETLQAVMTHPGSDLLFGH